MKKLLIILFCLPLILNPVYLLGSEYYWENKFDPGSKYYWENKFGPSIITSYPFDLSICISISKSIGIF
jgi:hypothetical protein